MSVRLYLIVIFYLCILGIFGVLFYSAGSELSYDYKHYYQFIQELSVTGFSDFVDGVVLGFPYYTWADFGKFEFGFAILVYVATQFFNVKAVYTFLALFSLSLKLFVFFKFRSPVFYVLSFVVFDITLFEANAMRAGLAVSFFLLALYFYIRSSLYISLVVFLVALSFHVSLAFFASLILCVLFLNRISMKNLFMFFMIFFVSLVILSVDLILPLMEGKLKDYYMQANFYDMYTGASGFNIISIILLLTSFVAFFSSISKASVSNKYANLRDFVNLSSLILFSVVFFSGKYSIFGDRLFQIFFPFVLVFYSLFFNGVYRFKWGKNIVFLIFSILLSYYVFYNILYAYPQSNFFEFITGYKDLESPELI